MARVNDHYLELKSSYLFSDIAKRIAAFGEAHPGAKLIRLGIGDVTRPLPAAVVQGAPRGRRRDGAPRELQGLWAGNRLCVPHRADRRARLRRPRRQGRSRRDLRQRRRQVRHHQYPGDLRRRLHGGAHRSRVSGLRRQQRDGGPRRPRRRDGALRSPGLSAGDRRERLQARTSRAGRSTSSISAIRTIRRARCSAARPSPSGWTMRGATRP